MASPAALREWCRVTCADYPGVDIKDLSASFRDGLAFCALIHKHRPDLIDFSSLSKHNAHQNHTLAFEVADRELGIPALLDVKDVVSCKTPDSLSIITYLHQYYWYFSSGPDAGPASLKSSHITDLHNVTKTKSRYGFKPLQSSTHLETSKDPLSSANPLALCKLCFRPVYLIQRHLVEGQIHHRSCFRCKLCQCTLLRGFYTQGREAGSLICQYHTTDSSSQQTGSSRNNHTCRFQAGYVSLSGLAVSSVPHYTIKTVSQEKRVCEMRTMVDDGKNAIIGLKSSVKKPAPLHPTPTRSKDGTGEGAGRAGPEPTAEGSGLKQEVTESQQLSEQTCARVTEGSGRPVPAPRRMLDSASVPVPAPRAKTSQTTSSSTAADSKTSQHPSALSSHDVTSPTPRQPKVKTHHPWLGIIHPGPWTQLPPAPPPVAPSRSKSISNLQGPWTKPKEAPPNPFGEEVDEEAREAAECAGQTEKACQSGSTGDLTSESGPQSCFLPRSVSVPSDTFPYSQGSSEPDDQTDADESVPPCQSEKNCKENPNPKQAMPRSKTVQALQSQRAPAPGHGFPLVKRKVQTDQAVSTGDLQEQMGELNKQLEALEQRGVELEKNLRHNKNFSQKQEEQMLMQWFSLIRERHVLVCRDTELAYLRKQQKLEEKQADVEYDLRCLLSRPDSDWTREDRNREKQLMGELVRIIEQRNQIISSLDQDRQRERSEDGDWETMMKNKELQKEGLKELKKSKGKLKPLKVFRTLSHKTENPKSSVEKKS